MTPPAVLPMVYGTSIDDAVNEGKIMTEGAVVFSYRALAHEDISAKGDFGWTSEGAVTDLVISSTTGTQSAIVFFRPLDTDVPNGGYEVGWKTVDIPVSPAAVSVGALAATGASIQLGQPLSDAGGALQSGVRSLYVFKGVLPGQEDMRGQLAWVSPTAIPGDEGYERDGYGNYATGGAFYAPAVFTPDPGEYGKAYEPLTFSLPVFVSAPADEIKQLEDEVMDAEEVQVQVVYASDNYDDGALSKLNDALAAAAAAKGKLESGALSQDEAEWLKNAIADAVAGLVQTHPVISNSAAGGVTQKDVPVDIDIQGQYESVEVVTFGGVRLALSRPAAGATSVFLLKDGKEVGVMKKAGASPSPSSSVAWAAAGKGGVLLSLYPDFVNTLADGTYRIELLFHDAFSSGLGSETFTVSRPPAAPAWLSASAEKDSVTLSWGAPASGSVTGYRVYAKRSADASWGLVAQAGADTLSYTVTGLTADTDYDFKVSAFNAAGEGEGAQIGARTAPDAPPPAPPAHPAPFVNGVSISGAVSVYAYKAGLAQNTLRLYANVSVTEGASTEVSWGAAGPASIDGSGLVAFSGAEGLVTVTLTSQSDTAKSDSVSIRVVKNVTGIRTPLKAYYVQRGKKLTIPIALDDSSAKTLAKPLKSALTFKSSNTKVLTVDKKGQVKANKKVKLKTRVKVRVTAANGKGKTITVYVVPKAAKLKKLMVSGYKTKMKVGQTGQLKLKLSPAKATGVKVTYKSSKKSGLYVD
jgi:hypothetical protein